MFGGLARREGVLGWGFERGGVLGVVRGRHFGISLGRQSGKVAKMTGTRSIAMNMRDTGLYMTRAGRNTVVGRLFEMRGCCHYVGVGAPLSKQRL
jgi:hypothetical protein